MSFERKINILYVITKLELGGAQKQLLSLIRGLNKEKFKPYLLTGQDGLLVDEAAMIPDLRLIRCKFLERPIHPAKDILALFFLYFFIKNNNIDVVHTHSSKAGILGRCAARLSGIRVIVHTVHGWSFHDYQHKIPYHLYMFLEKACAAFTSKIIVVSRSDLNKGLAHAVGRRDQYELIRYAVNNQEFKNSATPPAARENLGLSGDGPVIGTVACLKKQKSPLDFIKLAAAIKKDFPDTKFILAGDGILRRKACSLIKKLKLEEVVILLSWRNDIPLILSCLDIFVLTSRWEGLPIAALEAMAAGVPLVATDTGGIREVITDGKTGYLVKPGDIQSMRNRVVELLKNTPRRNEFVRLSRESIGSGEFSLGNMLRDTEGIYSGLLGGGRNA
ncbi:MAG: glycosyltransferase family 4 protein [Candidatus Omnitrophica bacterium]|nr:glycosyltransferase family 4 protein [Candidatus Omnitrophota bacterium]